MPLVSDRFLFEIAGLSQTLRVARFHGREALSELFDFEVTLLCDDPAIALDDVVGKPAHLTLLGDDATSRFVSGIVSAFEQTDVGKKAATYRARLVPRPWRLLHRFDCRIFQNQTAPDILTKVFLGAGLAKGDDFRLSLQATYATREYCVQYRESDWAFACRLMEEEGIHFQFVHSEEGHVLVLGDRPAAHADIEGTATVVFRRPLGAMGGGEHVQRFHVTRQVVSGKATLRDYNFVKPSLLLEDAASATDHADLEVYDYPGDYVTPGGFAALRLAERQVHRTNGTGESACPRLAAGSTFTLSEHPREDFNAPYLLTSVEHQGAAPTLGDDAEAPPHLYENHFQCIPASVPFRPSLLTPRPSVKGVQSAIVTGPSGEEIYTDEHGRVKVQFHWDRLGKLDDKSSCWLRVSQVWAGEGWGAIHIPRVGQEVLVDFVDGDPDRPIVVGRVYHGTNVVPYPLPANKTRSTVKSNSTPGGGGSNELCFEDKKGNEEIYLHGQKDWVIAVENDKTQTVGHDEAASVKNDRSMAVGHDQTIKVDHDESFTVTHDRSKSVGHDETETISHDRTIQVGNDHTESVGGNLSLTVTKDMTQEVDGASTEKVGKDLTVTVSGKYGLEVDSAMTVKVKSSSTEDVDLDRKLTAGQTIVFTCGDAKVTLEKNGNVTIVSKNLSVKVDGPIKVDGQKVEVTSSGEVKVTASGKVEVTGSGPMSLNASGPVKVKGANVGIN